MGSVAPLVSALTSLLQYSDGQAVSGSSWSSWGLAVRVEVGVEGGGTVDNAPNLVDGDATKTDTKSTALNKASDKLGGE